MPVSKINHKNKEIFVIDYRGLKTTDEMKSNLDSLYVKVLEDFEKDKIKVLCFADMRDCHISNSYLQYAKAMAQKYEFAFERVSIIGVKGVRKTMLKAYNAVISNPATRLVPFDTKEEALDWLVE